MEITVEQLAAALERIGQSRVEDLAWDPYANPRVHIGDPDENVLAEDPYPMASLARAIMEELSG